ncbi:alpha/beta hydrolase [Candidatus Margulisiibacteriota bacterium]
MIIRFKIISIPKSLIGENISKTTGGKTIHFPQYYFKSQYLKKTMSYYAFIPHRAPDEQNPIIFLLHGQGGHWYSFKDQAEQLMGLAEDNHIIIVTPDGTTDGWWIDSPLVPDNQVESYFIKELIPSVKMALSTSAKIGVAGVSMGAYGALLLPPKHRGIFSAAASMSAITDIINGNTLNKWRFRELFGVLKKNRALWEANSARQLFENNLDIAGELPLFICCGNKDHMLKENRALHEMLKENKIEHEYMEGNGGHLDYWLSPSNPSNPLSQVIEWMALKLR